MVDLSASVVIYYVRISDANVSETGQRVNKRAQVEAPSFSPSDVVDCQLGSLVRFPAAMMTVRCSQQSSLSSDMSRLAGFGQIGR